jgi:hypothetical protein
MVQFTGTALANAIAVAKPLAGYKPTISCVFRLPVNSLHPVICHKLSGNHLNRDHNHIPYLSHPMNTVNEQRVMWLIWRWTPSGAETAKPPGAICKRNAV